MKKCPICKINKIIDSNPLCTVCLTSANQALKRAKNRDRGEFHYLTVAKWAIRRYQWVQQNT
jgi:hypothetical protein